MPNVYNSKLYKTVTVDINGSGECQVSYEETSYIQGVNVSIDTASNGLTITRYYEDEPRVVVVVKDVWDLRDQVEAMVTRKTTVLRSFSRDEYDETTLDKLRDAGAAIPHKESVAS